MELFSAVSTGPKAPAAANMLYIMTLTSRLESACFIGMGMAAAWTLTLPFESRYPALFVFGMVGIIAMSVSLNHYGVLPFFGNNPFITDTGRDDALNIIILWTLTHAGLWTGFFGSRAAAQAGKDKST